MQAEEAETRLAQGLLVGLGFALVTLLGLDWWQLTPPLARVNDDLQQIQEREQLRTTACQRYLSDSKTRSEGEAKLIQAEQDFASAELPQKLQLLQKYRRGSLALCDQARVAARANRSPLYIDLSTHTGESTAQIRRTVRVLNQHCQEYNLTVKRFPAFLARPLFGLPEQLPLTSEAD